jgi:hypothetical protein
MVSLRKRYRVESESSPPVSTSPSQGAELPPVTADEPQLDEQSVSETHNPVDAAAHEEMMRRLADTERADTLPRQPPPQPQLSARDRDFLNSRPGVDKDPRLQIVARAFAEQHEYGSPAFYEALENAFPAEDYRPTKAAPSRQQSPGSVSAPPTREPASWSTGRPLSDSTLRLTAQEAELARTIGITPEAYLQGKRRMLEEKRAGFHDDQR